MLFPKFVKIPSTPSEVVDCSYEYALAGCSGALGSGDATHGTLEKCSARLRNNHLGGKSKFTTRAFNMTVNHRRRILWTSQGCPGRWNDKTLQLYDELFRGIRDGTILDVSDTPPHANRWLISLESPHSASLCFPRSGCGVRVVGTQQRWRACSCSLPWRVAPSRQRLPGVIVDDPTDEENRECMF